VAAVPLRTGKCQGGLHRLPLPSSAPGSNWIVITCAHSCAINLTPSPGPLQPHHCPCCCITVVSISIAAGIARLGKGRQPRYCPAAVALPSTHPLRLRAMSPAASTSSASRVLPPACSCNTSRGFSAAALASSSTRLRDLRRSR
jgi:hypothetical protein